MTDTCVVLTTTASATEAEQIASALVEEELAACVNIISTVTSVYRWKGAVQKDQEWLLLIKTRTAVFDRVSRRIRELHSYELPECIQISIAGGSSNYLNWIAENTRNALS